MDRFFRYEILALVAAFLAGNRSLAHRVASQTHDRTIQVHIAYWEPLAVAGASSVGLIGSPLGQGPILAASALFPGKTAWLAKAERFTVRVAYRLEVDEDTAILTDLKEAEDRINLVDFRGQPGKFYRAFVNCYATIIAKNLDAALDTQDLEFSCVQSSYRLQDEQGVKLGHLRCDFVFEAKTVVAPGKQHRFEFREGNYEKDAGQVRLSFHSNAPIRIRKKEVPDLAWLDRPEYEQNRNKLRTIRATFSLPTSVKDDSPKDKQISTQTPSKNKKTPAKKAAVQVSDPGDDEPVGDHSTLKGLFLDSKHGLVLLLLLAAGIGAVHALTPGHGKTLVAAYLVGEQGTVWHALALGLVTTLTHTGVVFVLAFLLLIIPGSARQAIQTGLELVMGLIIVCLGFWLLLRRLSGGADHFHLPGHGHHHHHGHSHHHHTHGPGQQPHDHEHGHADHYHDEQGHAHPVPRKMATLGWWGLVALGISGGIVPCWDAIAMLFLAVGMNLLWLAFPLLLAFSTGLASVLVLIGILVVKAKGFAESHWGDSRLIRALPVISAAVVTLMGLWLCYDSVRTHSSEPTSPRKQAKRQVSRSAPLYSNSQFLQ